jgi:hypothetical protein
MFVFILGNTMKQLIMTILLFNLSTAFAEAVYINRIKLNQDELMVLQAVYGSVEPGRYWYDSMAGLWGYENGPTQGRAIPYIDFRGLLPADISGTGTGIFINNREIHFAEKQYLESIYGMGSVKTGSYWLNNIGIGGYEGQAASFKITQLTHKKPVSPFSTRDLVGGSVVGQGYVDANGDSATW